jgi:hypothetical protein
MNKSINLLLPVLLLTASLAFAKAPIRSLDKTILGIEYTGQICTQYITNASVGSYTRSQVFRLEYSPVEYGQVWIGAGATRFETEAYSQRKFDGKYGFAPAAGLALNSPALLKKMIRVTAGFDFVYLNSTDAFEYRYIGPILSPSAGVLLHAGSYVDVEVGAKGLIINGTMKNTETSIESAFSNATAIRGYGKVSLIAPSGVYGQLSFEASPDVSTDLSSFPQEFGIGFSIGVLLSDDMSSNRMFKKNDKKLEDLEKQKKRLKDMGESLK